MALWKFVHFKLFSKISRKVFELGAWNLVSWYGMMCRLPIKHLSKVQNFLWNYKTANSACLGISKCWGHSVLQTPALVVVVTVFRKWAKVQWIIRYFIYELSVTTCICRVHFSGSTFYSFDPNMPSGLVYPYILDKSIYHLKVVRCIFSFTRVVSEFLRHSPFCQKDWTSFKSTYIVI